jgi:NTP pyrophosphatase (non-canonical NTP hydrolase)
MPSIPKEKLLELSQQAIRDEYEQATKDFPDWPSLEHGFTVLQEEVAELFEELRRKPRSIRQLEQEAIQVGAMALRFLITLEDLYSGDRFPPSTFCRDD